MKSLIWTGPQVMRSQPTLLNSNPSGFRPLCFHQQHMVYFACTIKQGMQTGLPYYGEAIKSVFCLYEPLRVRSLAYLKILHAPSHS